ncbi:hypothetical protein [Galbibacter orientalis]|uniref:Uncharacterized protein n=1 Tax=Galbibacter orientalis DSM 19592 TaxID=926559 RepID=I3C3B4_9FLAO|nr:hypothetical protein JoomaDRAFT_1087 [Galbibacter orientalis DSM 19592]
MNHVLITDFKSDSTYLKLQNRFLKKCDAGSFYNKQFKEPRREDFDIKYNEGEIVFRNDELFSKDKYITVSFHKWLVKRMNVLAQNYITSFKEILEERLILDEDQVKLLAKKYVMEAIEVEEYVKNSQYLNYELKNKLKNQISKIIEYLSQIHVLSNYGIDDRIKINANKNDLLLLFLLLREHKFIDCPYDSELGFLIEKSFMFYDEKTEEYKYIQKAGKELNNIKNNNKPVEKSFKRLKKILTSIIESNDIDSN